MVPSCGSPTDDHAASEAAPRASRTSAGPIKSPRRVVSVSAAPRTIWLRITPEFPRAPINAACATVVTTRFRSTTARELVRRFSSASSTALIVPAMLSPVSPSATGNTFRSLISSRRSSRCAWATATTRWKRSTDGSPIAGRIIAIERALRALGVLGDLVGLQAAGADVDASRAPGIFDPDLLQVRLEAPARGHHRVAARVAESWALSAAEADLGHNERGW